MVTSHVSVERRSTNKGFGTEAAGIGSPSLMFGGNMVAELDGIHELGRAPVTFVLVVLYSKVIHLEQEEKKTPGRCECVYVCVCVCVCVCVSLYVKIEWHPQ